MENAQGTLTGDVIVWDRQNNHLTASNQKMIFRQNLNGAGDRHQRTAGNTAAGENQFSAGHDREH